MPELTVIVLAAGEGTRMKSSLPKVLHPLCGRPMLAWVLEAAEGAARSARRVAVVGRGREETARLLEGRGWSAAHQEKRLGTGHAVRTALEALPAAAGDVLVLSGDTPLLTAATLRGLLSRHRSAAGVMTLLTARPPDPAGYGRVVRDHLGRVSGIVEQKELGRRPDPGEINAGMYVFDAAFLRRELPRLRRHRSSGEYYLTDLAAAAVRAGSPPAAVVLSDPEEAAGVNSRRQLAAAGEVLRRRILGRLMDAGVTVVDPAATWVDAGVRVGADTLLLPGTTLEGDTRVGKGCRVGPHARLVDSRLADGARVLDGSLLEGARVGRGASVGPMAHLRAGAVVGEGARVGNFVEVKKSRLGKGAKASHLTYLGDAEVGAGANIGAGTITCNYDGRRKHRTVIGAGAFVGSNSALVAPVTVGPRAVVGAGTVVVRDVPADALAVARPPQEVKPGWARRRRAMEGGKG